MKIPQFLEDLAFLQKSSFSFQHGSFRRLQKTYQGQYPLLSDDWWQEKEVVLLDMDGTLLVQPKSWFTSMSIGLLCQSFLKHTKSLQEVFAAFEFAYRSMHDVSLNFSSNQKAFVEMLAQNLRLQVNQIEESLRHFVSKEYRFLCRFLKGMPFSKEFVKTLKDQNKQVILATNPICGQAEISLRLKRAYLALSDFDHVTSWENTRGVKPQKIYYEELLNLKGVSSQNCVMIGNDRYYDCPPYDLGLESVIINHRLSLQDLLKSLAA